MAMVLSEEIRVNIWLRKDGAIVYESILDKRYGADYIKHLLDVIADNIVNDKEIDWDAVEADLDSENSEQS